MKALQHTRGYRVRSTLASAIGVGCALLLFPLSVSAKSFLCTAQEVAVFPGLRIHVSCNPGDGPIAFFVLSVGDPDASRVLSLAATAVAARRSLLINYDPSDLSGAPIGCPNSNCRLIQAIFLERQ